MLRGLGDSDDGFYDTIITTDLEGARTRNVEEMSVRITQAGGALVVGPNSSEFIVAVNNRLRFNVEPDPANPGMYRITQGFGIYYLGLGALVLVAALILKK